MDINANDSILITIKKLRNISEEDTSFDTDVISAINTSLAFLKQVGVGPDTGFRITGVSETWNNYIKDDDSALSMAQTYIDKQTQLIFDPPASSAHIQASKEILKEVEWRLNAECDNDPIVIGE